MLGTRLASSKQFPDGGGGGGGIIGVKDMRTLSTCTYRTMAKRLGLPTCSEFPTPLLPIVIQVLT